MYMSSAEYKVPPIAAASAAAAGAPPATQVVKDLLGIHSANSTHRPLEISCVNDYDDAVHVPSALPWRARADATGLTYLSHPDAQVRTSAIQLLKQVQV